MPSRHTGEVRVQLHSFLNIRATAALPYNPSTRGREDADDIKIEDYLTV